MQTKRKFARAKNRKGRKIATVDVTNNPTVLPAMLADPNVGSVEVKYQGGRQDGYAKPDPLPRITAKAGILKARGTRGAPATKAANKKGRN
jgi:hypothetical protein